MPSRRSRAFCHALAEETGSQPQRWDSIDSVADRLGINQDKAEVIAAELEAAHLVLVGGGHSVTLTEAGGSWRKGARAPVLQSTAQIHFVRRHRSQPRQRSALWK